MAGKVKTNKWNNEFYVTAYRAARDGLNNKQIAKLLGVGFVVFDKWMKVKPAFRVAVESGREKNDNSAVDSFHQFIHGRLPPAAKAVWDELIAAEEMFDESAGKNDRRDAVIELIATKGRKLRQHLFLHAMICSNFQTTIACRRTGIPVAEVKGWATKDHGFAELIRGIHQCKKDFFEAALIDLVARRDSAAVIFVNKTVNKDRGYGEPKDDTAVKRVRHEHRLILDDLPLEAQRAVLESIRKRAPQLTDNRNVIDVTPEVK